MVVKLLLYLVWPFAAFVYSLKQVGKVEFYTIFLLMSVFLGLNMYVSGENGFSGDITRYLVDVRLYKHIPWVQIFAEKDFFLGATGKIFSQLSTNPRFLCVVYYLIYTWWFLQAFSIVTRHFRLERTLWTCLCLFSILTVLPFSYFNALRFAMATMLYLWVILEILINKRKIFYAIIFFVPIIHFAYWVMVPLPFLWLFLRNHLMGVLVIFLISFAFSTASTSYTIYNIVEKNFDETVTGSISGYASEEGRENMVQRYNDLAEGGSVLRAISRWGYSVRNNTVMIIVVLLTLAGYRSMRKDRAYRRTMTLFLLAASTANIASSVSNGDRFYHIVSAIIVFVFFYAINTNNDEYTAFKSFLKRHIFYLNILIVAVSIYGVMTLYMGRVAFSYPSLLFGNVFFSLFKISFCP